jgi:hypothetical protein
MRYLIAAALWIAFLALSQMPAEAQTPAPECRTIKVPVERLACYDKLNPPEATKVVAAAPRGTKAAKANDPVGDEEELMKTRLHDICQHC